jgi:hypothetical protein
VLELEGDLRTTTMDLATMSRQFSQATDQLQVVTEKVSRLQNSNAKLSQDLEGKSDDPPVLAYLSACFLSGLDLMTLVAGSRMIRAGMAVQLATVKQERNATILKVIEKDSVLKRLSEQLQSTYQTWVLSPCYFSSSRAHRDSLSSLALHRSRPSWSSPRHLGSRTRPP